MKPGTPKSEKLKAASGKVALPPGDTVTLLFFFCHEQDQDVKAAAIASLRALPETFLLEFLADDTLHPRLLDVLARLHVGKHAVAELIAGHPHTEQNTLDFLQGKGIAVSESLPGESADPEPDGSAGATQSMEESNDEEDAEEENDEEEFKSKYQMVQQMGVAEKIKAALTGDKEFRSLLIKDTNKLVSGAVVKNPRITEAEILTIAKSVIQNDDIMRVICTNKEWVKNYAIRKAIVENSKSPLPMALRFLGTLTEKDLEKLAKSKNISTVIATQARRLLTKFKK